MTTFIHALYDTFEYYRKYYTALNELASLSDEELEYLGISRHEIPYIVTKTLNKWTI